MEASDTGQFSTVAGTEKILKPQALFFSRVDRVKYINAFMWFLWNSFYGTIFVIYTLTVFEVIYSARAYYNRGSYVRMV